MSRSREEGRGSKSRECDCEGRVDADHWMVQLSCSHVEINAVDSRWEIWWMDGEEGRKRVGTGATPDVAAAVAYISQ